MLRYIFFLGGQDLEMVAIREILCRVLNQNGSKVVGIIDHHLSWGAKASDYKQEIEYAATRGWTPVLVELAIDIDLPEGAIVIDHHNEFSDRPASILQVIKLLEIKSNWHQQLIAANDSGYIPAMEKMGASTREIDQIRWDDRQAQGVTVDMEAQAERAVMDRKMMGLTTYVELPHLKPSTVTDRLYRTWPLGQENLLVRCSDGRDTHVYYFGRGDICKRLGEAFSPPNGFCGGSGLGKADANAFAGVNNAEVADRFIAMAVELASGA